jgi:hypothetical protein
LWVHPQEPNPEELGVSLTAIEDHPATAPSMATVVPPRAKRLIATSLNLTDILTDITSLPH